MNRVAQMESASLQINAIVPKVTAKHQMENRAYPSVDPAVQMENALPQIIALASRASNSQQMMVSSDEPICFVRGKQKILLNLNLQTMTNSVSQSVILAVPMVIAWNQISANVIVALQSQKMVNRVLRSVNLVVPMDFAVLQIIALASRGLKCQNSIYPANRFAIRDAESEFVSVLTNAFARRDLSLTIS